LGAFLLVFFIRKRYFQNHSNIDSILNGDDLELLYTDTAKNLPVFIRATIKGFHLDPGNEPMTDKGHQTYTELVFLALGIVGAFLSLLFI
jgi:hypothetical protein